MITVTALYHFFSPVLMWEEVQVADLTHRATFDTFMVKDDISMLCTT